MSKFEKLKQTEIGLIPKEWSVEKIDSAIKFNPKRELKNGTLAKKVAMDKLNPFSRKIHSFETTNYKGGSKFINGDTLLARITPCLENGKTAFVDILKNNETGFGSTEFIVLSGIEKVSTDEFVYYLSISPRFREQAISSMTGTSGRQRIQIEFLTSKKIALPPIQEQKAIAKILSDLDSKIELLQEQNKTLEEIGKRVFKQWFVDFEFPNEEGKPYKSSGGKLIESEMGEIPEGWEVGNFGSMFELIMGLSPKGESYTESKGTPLINGAAEFSKGFIQIQKYTTQPTRVCKTGDLLLCIRGTIGNLTYADKEYCLGRGVASIKEKQEFNREFIYFKLQKLMTELTAKASGSVIVGLSKPDILDFRIIKPSEKILLSFSEIMKPIFIKKETNKICILKLQNTRDLLLPKLMTGKIRVKL